MSRAVPRFRRNNPPLPVPTNNVYEVTLSGVIAGQETITTFYYADANAKGTGQAPASLLNVFKATVVPAQAAVSATNWSATFLTCRLLTDNTTVSIGVPISPNVPGTVAGLAEGTIAAPTIVRQTAFRGQTGRGHVNLPGLPDSFTTADGTSLTGAALTAYDNFAIIAMETPLVQGANTFTPVLASRGTRTQMPKVLGAAPIVNGFARLELGTIRRRKIGRGK